MNNIGMIYKAQGNYSEALERYEEALQINEQNIEPEFIMNFEGEFYGISIHSGKKSPRRVQFKQYFKSSQLRHNELITEKEKELTK